MICSLYSEGALSRSVMLAHAESIACQTEARSCSPVRARTTDPDTSKKAAVKAARFAASHYGRILSALEMLGSGTAQEIGAECGLSVVQCDRRLPELQRDGRIRLLVGIDGKPLIRAGFRIWAGV